MFQEDKYQNNKIIETGLLQMVPTDLEPLVQPSEHFDQVPKLCFLQESTDEPCLVLGLVNALYHLAKLHLPVRCSGFRRNIFRFRGLNRNTGYVHFT